MNEPLPPNYPENWFKEGVKFECTECGLCCTGGPGTVFLTEEDIARFIEQLKITQDEFLAAYTHEVDGHISLKENDNYDCIFLKDNRCSVHLARPLQCRTYPFWVDRMRSPKAWEDTEIECPGVGRGKLYAESEILEILEQDLQRVEYQGGRDPTSE